ncbi:NAD(P)-dependent alcohol dehydrogenase [bacterium SCSIO 12741]|nr:NAD(P)-dependent alcohol dehydrogenase [bacterium SCSIO 12741]
MKAIIQSAYGEPEKVLSLQDVPTPEPKEGEVLIRVHASAINDYDWSMSRGKPHLYRLLFGLTKPKNPIPGMEVAGTVEKLGPGTTQFKPGDEVYGDTSDHGFGTLAEYICLSEKSLIIKPSAMSFEEATTLPHAGLLAYQGLFEIGNLQKGQKLLINGGGGGVGTLGLQLAKALNVEVTGVDTGGKLEMMKSLGFDNVIDYKKEDFTRSGKQYDLILDCKTSRPPRSYLRSLSSNGHYVTVGGHLNRLMQFAIASPLVNRTSSKKLSILSLKPNKGLYEINRLFEDGKIKPIVDGPYPLEKTPWAIQYFGEGLHSGKIVISVLDSRSKG